MSTSEKINRDAQSYMDNQKDHGYYFSLTTAKRAMQTIRYLRDAGWGHGPAEDLVNSLIRFAYHDGEDNERAEH